MMRPSCSVIQAEGACNQTTALMLMETDHPPRPGILGWRCVIPFSSRMALRYGLRA